MRRGDERISQVPDAGCRVAEWLDQGIDTADEGSHH